MMRAGTGIFFIRRQRLPYDAEVEYLQSDGATFVQLPFRPTNNIAFALTVYRGANSQRWDCGAQTGWSSNAARFIIQENQYCYWQYGATATQTSITPSHNLVGTLVCTVSGRSCTVRKIGGNTYSKTYNASTFTAPANFALFAVGTSPTTSAVAASSGSRLFSAVVSDTGVSFDLIPVRFKNSQGVSEGALYDRENPSGGPLGNGLYPATSTAKFTGSLIGPDKTT